MLLLTSASRDGPLARAADCKSTVSGDLRIHSLASKIFNNTRSIRVLLPPGYGAAENSSKRYPVLYMLDGQNLFDACLSDVSHAEWQVDETVYRLIREKAIPEMIVVGIDHAGVKRAYEFLPYRDSSIRIWRSLPASVFRIFSSTEVMPFVNGQYRTLTGHGNTALGGSSYGGVATLYALMARPQTFGYGLIESPSIWVGMGQLIRDTSPLVGATAEGVHGIRQRRGVARRRQRSRCKGSSPPSVRISKRRATTTVISATSTNRARSTPRAPGRSDCPMR